MIGGNWKVEMGRVCVYAGYIQSDPPDDVSVLDKGTLGTWGAAEFRALAPRVHLLGFGPERRRSDVFGFWRPN